MARFRVELFEAIRRNRRIEKLSIRELGDKHSVHRCTVRQALASAMPPPRKASARRSRPAMDPWVEVIDSWLLGDREVPRKQRHIPTAGVAAAGRRARRERGGHVRLSVSRAEPAGHLAVGGGQADRPADVVVVHLHRAPRGARSSSTRSPAATSSFSSVSDATLRPGTGGGGGTGRSHPRHRPSRGRLPYRDAEEPVETVKTAHRDESFGLDPVPPVQHPDHRRLEVVVTDPALHRAEVLERKRVTFQERLLRLGGEQDWKDLPECDNPIEHPHLDPGAGDGGLELTEVALGLRSRRMRLRHATRTRSEPPRSAAARCNAILSPRNRGPVQSAPPPHWHRRTRASPLRTSSQPRRSRGMITTPTCPGNPVRLPLVSSKLDFRVPHLVVLGAS